MREQIIEYIKKQFGKNHFSYCHFPECDCNCKSLDNIDENTNLISGGYIDSFSMVVLLVWIEKTFKVKIPEKSATIENFDSVNKIVELIK